jgi:hypothetical protein
MDDKSHPIQLQKVQKITHSPMALIGVEESAVLAGVGRSIRIRKPSRRSDGIQREENQKIQIRTNKLFAQLHRPYG